MAEVIPGGRPGIPAPDKPRRARRPHRHKPHAPFLHAHPLAKPRLSAPVPAPANPADGEEPE